VGGGRVMYVSANAIGPAGSRKAKKSTLGRGR
jgi:hypothetical protein